MMYDAATHYSHQESPSSGVTPRVGWALMCKLTFRIRLGDTSIHGRGAVRHSIPMFRPFSCFLLILCAFCCLVTAQSAAWTCGARSCGVATSFKPTQKIFPCREGRRKECKGAMTGMVLEYHHRGAHNCETRGRHRRRRRRSNNVRRPNNLCSSARRPGRQDAWKPASMADPSQSLCPLTPPRLPATTTPRQGYPRTEVLPGGGIHPLVLLGYQVVSLPPPHKQEFQVATT